MSDIVSTHGVGDPEPPEGTHLSVGGKQDRIHFVRTDTGWVTWHNGERARPCTYALIQYWAPLHVVSGSRIDQRGSS